MIEVRSLTKRYGARTAVDDISFTVNDGEILGFLGPNGAGKSTTMNIITGYLSSTAGTVTVDGKEILEEPLAVRARIGYLPEQPPLYPDMTVGEYLHFMYGLKKVRGDRDSQIRGICDRVGIGDVRERLIKNLSKGYRQRVGLAQALLGNPPVLILDEPTVGFDPGQMVEIRRLIRELGKEHTVLLSSHILSEVQAVCQRVLVIDRGRLVADDTPENLSRHFSPGRSLTARIEGPKSGVLELLHKLPGLVRVEALASREPGTFDYLLEPEETADLRRELFRRLADRAWPLLELTPNRLSLEDVFMQLVASDGEATAGGEESL